MLSLSLPESTYAELASHLASSEVEEVAFLFTQEAQPGEHLRVAELYPVPREGFDIQSDLHVCLTDEVRAKVIKRAHELGGCLVEVHSHESKGPAWFSASDLYGFEEWVPHVRWRLGGRPYVALVFAGDSFDALLWEGDDQTPGPLASLEVDGSDPRLPSGITYRRLRSRCR